MGSSRGERTKRRQSRRLLPARPLRFLRSLAARRLILSFLGGGLLVSALITAGLFAYFSRGLPDITQFSHYRVSRPVRIYDRQGVRLSVGKRWDYWTVKSDKIPKVLKDAVVAVEDHRFYRHHGIDAVGILRALWVNALTATASQGGSTITQQLSKNLFLTPEKTFERKIREAILAIKVESCFSKDEILALYLNHVYFGSGISGVGPAARFYFNKDPHELNLPEAATLAGLLKAPERYSPHRNLELAKGRRELVLKRMVAEGSITMGQAIDAASAQLPAAIPADMEDPVESAYYFTDWIYAQTAVLLGDDRVRQGGLEIYSTLEPRLQRAAAEAIQRHLLLQKKNSHTLQAALVSLDGKGGILAMVGGRSYRESQYNRATEAMRQPGSAFKPILYAAAIEAGVRSDSLYEDSPITTGNYHPNNFDGRFRGTVTVADALAQSINTVAVKVAMDIGVNRVQDMARRMGITSPLHSGASLALGTAECTLFELTQAYAALATNGMRVWAHGIEKITDSEGRLLYRFSEPSHYQALPSPAALEMTGLLTRVITEGTGRPAQLDRPAAGKTGTSSDYRDAWFVGYTAHMVTGVWLGNDSGASVPGLTGGSVAAQTWKDYMLAAHRGLPASAICEEPGRLPEAGEVAPRAGRLIRSIRGKLGGLLDRLRGR